VTKPFITPNRLRRLVLLACVLLSLAVPAACQLSPAGPETTATTPEGTPATPNAVFAIVTRIVERTVIVTPTPDPSREVTEERAPVELDLPLENSLPDLDPQRATSDTQIDLAENLFAGLTNYDAAADTIVPELATRWEVGPDGRTWTFTLRDDIYWVRAATRPTGEEGLRAVEALRPVTADDVVFAVQRVCSGEIENELAYALFIIEGCELVSAAPQVSEADLASIGIRAVDDTTLEITLTKPAGYFLALTSTPLFQAVPRDLVEEFGTEWEDAVGGMGTGWQTPPNLVTSGPFVLIADETISQRVVLQRNPLWPIDRGGNVEIVNLYFVEDADGAYDLWQARTIDLSPLPAAEREALLARSPEKARLVPQQVLFYLGFNFDSPIFREPEVRRAFSAAIDRDALIEEIYGGRGIAMRHMTVPGVVGAVPPDEVGVGYSPDYARQQMANSSFKTCRLMTPFTFLVSSADLSLRQAELIRQMWVDELDCPEETINIEQAQFGALLAGTRQDAGSARPDLWELAWAPGFPDAHVLMSDLLHCADSENRQNRECSEADTLLRRAASSTDPAERTALYRQVENLFFGENGLFPIVPLYVRATGWAVQDWLSFTPTVYGGEQFDTYRIDEITKELERSRNNP
jgi:oligopeptide transport system substrate-binding protein